MQRLIKPLHWLWEQFFDWAPGAGVWFARRVYFWGLVARSYLVRRGALSRGKPARSPMPAAPAAIPAARIPAAAAGHA